MLTGFITEWLYVNRLTGTLWIGLNHFCSPYSAQLKSQ